MTPKSSKDKAPVHSRPRPATPARPPRDADAVWLTPAEAAGYLGLSTQTLARWRVAGDGPPFRSPADAPRVVRYLRADLDTWLGEHRRSTSSQPAA